MKFKIPRIQAFPLYLAALVLLVLAQYSAFDWFGAERFSSAHSPLWSFRTGLFLLLLVPGLLISRYTRELRGTPSSRVLVATLVLYLASVGTVHPWFFFFGWIGWGIVTFILLLSALLIYCPRRVPFVLLLLVLFLLYLSFIKWTHLRALYRDDHPSFLFRLHEYALTFPAMNSLNPYWNAGVVNSVGASSGVGVIALPFYFLFRFFPAHNLYSPVLGICFFFCLPLSTYLALRILGANRMARIFGAILALAGGRFFYVWALHFGTVGATTAVSLLPLVSALIYQITIRRRGNWRLILLFGIALALFFQWFPCMIMAAMFVPGWLWNVCCRRFRIKPHLQLLLGIALAALILLPNIFAVFDNSELINFVGTKGSALGASSGKVPHIQMLLKTLSHRLPEINPLVLIFGILGAWFLPHRHMRRYFAPPTLLFFLLAAWGPAFFPKMQLERMAIPAAFAGIIPAAFWCGRIWRYRRFDRAIIGATLGLSLVTVFLIFRGQGYAPVHFMPDKTIEFAELLRREVPANCRLIFYGNTLHYYDGGHIAYLPLLCDREMMACDYYAFPPGTVEYDYPPRPWRETTQGIADFMRLHAATHIAVRRTDHADFLKSAPELFEEVEGAPFVIFRLLDPVTSPFVEGRGKITARNGSITIENHGGEPFVIRYNFFPTLHAKNATLEAFSAAEGIRFIRVIPTSEAEVKIFHK